MIVDRVPLRNSVCQQRERRRAQDRKKKSWTKELGKSWTEKLDRIGQKKRVISFSLGLSTSSSLVGEIRTVTDRSGTHLAIQILVQHTRSTFSHTKKRTLPHKLFLSYQGFQYFLLRDLLSESTVSRQATCSIHPRERRMKRRPR